MKTWGEFFSWIERVGIKYCPGDIHYAGQGYWYPYPPNITTGAEFPKPAEPWIHVFKSEIDDGKKTIQTVDVLTSYDTNKYGLETPADALKAVQRALIDFDEASGFGPPPGGSPFKGLTDDDSDVSDSCDLGAHERCSHCGCGCHQKLIFKACSCGREHSRGDWNELALLGQQKVEADGDDPACIFEARNCRCGSTLMVELPA